MLKRADLGKYLGIKNIKETYRDIETIPRKYVLNECALVAPPKAGTNWHVAFISSDDALGIATCSRKPKVVDLIKWLAKKGVEKIQEEHRQAITRIQREHQLTVEEDQQATALLSNDLQDRENQIKAIQYENVGLQGEMRAKDLQIAASQRRYVGYLANEDKNNGTSIIVKNNEAAKYLYISICTQHGYRRHKVKILLAHNQGSELFVDEDIPNPIVTYYFWQEDRLIVVDPNRPRHFTLEMINEEQLLALNDT